MSSARAEPGRGRYATNDGQASIMKRYLVAVRQHCPNLGLLTIDARPEQSQQSNQSHCEADEYISPIRGRFLANAVR